MRAWRWFTIYVSIPLGKAKINEEAEANTESINDHEGALLEEAPTSRFGERRASYITRVGASRRTSCAARCS